MCDDQNPQETLASCPGLGSITVCPCGTVSLHVGGVSVRMELTAYMQVAKMCHVAMLSLDHQFRTVTNALENASTRDTSATSMRFKSSRNTEYQG